MSHQYNLFCEILAKVNDSRTVPASIGAPWNFSSSSSMTDGGSPATPGGRHASNRLSLAAVAASGRLS
jgi:hypothetical protein